MAVIMPPPIHPARGPAPEWSDRFWPHVEPTESCWLWRGPTSAKGYGNSSTVYRYWGTSVAHRIVFLWVYGEIPEGMVLDHLCRVRNCVNPDHLEPVTNRENVLRGTSIIAQYAARTHCAEGHKLPESFNGSPRNCRECQTRYQRVKRYRQPSESESAGTCSGCGLIRHVRVNGLMHRHKVLGGGVCDGSGRPPATQKGDAA